jgi:cytochrome b561
MSEAVVAGRQRNDEAVFGWILALCFFVLLYNIISLPRTALEDRAALRAFHDSFGLVFIVLSVWRLSWMARRPGPLPPAGLPAASFGFNRAILVALYLTFVLTGVIGLLYGWGEFEREVVLFGLHLPSPTARTTLSAVCSATFIARLASTTFPDWRLAGFWVVSAPALSRRTAAPFARRKGLRCGEN